MGSESLLRELAFTGRDFTSDEAKEHGFVSRVFDDRQSMCEKALEVCQQVRLCCLSRRVHIRSDHLA